MKYDGNMLQLRWTINAGLKAGRSLMQDFNRAVAALKLEDVTDPGKKGRFSAFTLCLPIYMITFLPLLF